MTNPAPHIGSCPVKISKGEVNGYFTQKDDETLYCIENYDLMDNFFMSIVNSSDLWMYLSSSGGLTAGRQNYNNALFAYETDDKIHLSAETTGPKTIIRIKDGPHQRIWEPFSERHTGLYAIQRNLYKNISGSKIIFEEINTDLQLVFSYSWMGSEKLGWVRNVKLKNLTSKVLTLDITDGLQNLLPWGITRDTQSMMSTLMDAYKVSEYQHNLGMALYHMSSIPVDRAEPSEALASNLVWCDGLNPVKVLLSSKQLKRLRKGLDVETETTLYGQKSSFFIHSDLELKPMGDQSWYILADVAKDIADIVALKKQLEKEKNRTAFIENNLASSKEKLHKLVTMADGIQKTNDPLNDTRHFANVMFNIMRGGIFEHNYKVEVKDFLDHLRISSKAVYQTFKELLQSLEPVIPMEKLLGIAQSEEDFDLIRLTREYLPLSFSRRHGDPSRPWNFFEIKMKEQDGSSSLNYQGNWRDIFQNWETLAFSFPAFLPGMIARFLNASTADGYNPYRIMRSGFDWEVPEPENPWAFIGYWGDHQIIYLLRLMELQEKFYPGLLSQNMNEPEYVYANVPYKIKKYSQILENPQDTIVFDKKLHDDLMQKSKTMGSDGKLCFSRHGKPQRASFTEKILVSLLTKLSNLIPEAGIWLNTQRPEWNDANNALVGNGASMVTLYHLRRFVKFLLKITTESQTETYHLADEVCDFLTDVQQTFTDSQYLLGKGFSNMQRKNFVNTNGLIAENYRDSIYSGFSGKQSFVDTTQLTGFLKLTIEYLDHSIAANRRSDNLYNSYNLISISADAISIQPLYLMLEGQVAILNSGILKAEETLNLIRTLFQSKLWREDQQSFMLYPFRQLPGFMEKNTISREQVNSSLLLTKLVAEGNNDIIKKDTNGQFHFNASLKNARLLQQTLNKLSNLSAIEKEESEISKVLEIYENIFIHREFTGRSGSFYKYEGLGSIYWHMVSKLLLALGENILSYSNTNSKQVPHLKELYYRIKQGIGLHKSPKQYGGFPTDPYSHTPSMMGAQQPGMTGQVKEDILSRFNELGLVANNGRIYIVPVLIKTSDFSKNGELNFNFCQIPFFYKHAETSGIEIHMSENTDNVVYIPELVIPKDISNAIFSRSNQIEKVIVKMDLQNLSQEI